MALKKKKKRKSPKRQIRKAPNPTGKNGDRTKAIEALKGNQYWKKRSKHGTDAVFADPETMLEAFDEYEQYCLDNPDYATEFKGTPLREVQVPLKRALFIEGFCVFIDTNLDWWNQFKRSKTFAENKDFSRVMKNIETRIRTDQITGGTNGKLNSMLIARILHLRENMSFDVNDQRKEAGDLFPDENDFKHTKK